MKREYKKEVLIKSQVKINEKEKKALAKLAKKLKVTEQTIKRAAIQEYLSNNR